jgi:general secretion pathway protein E
MTAPADLRARLHLSAELPAQITLFAPRGCSECSHTGYRGRQSIVEFLAIDDGIRALIMQRAGATAIQRTAVAHGMRTMYEDGMLKACAGLTSVEEVLRVSRGQEDGAVSL